MSEIVRFSVDPSLTQVLGSTYRNAETALKELVDNSWDADATEVHITLPDPVSDDPVVVRDNGVGMSPSELKLDYLKIASSRTRRRGEFTQRFHRKVKGRKGVGKFAGLELSEAMHVETRSGGFRTTLLVDRALIAKQPKDLEEVELPSSVEKVSPNEHGTTITLRRMGDSRGTPEPEAMSELLAFDYGSVNDFSVFVNGRKVARVNVDGEPYKHEAVMPSGYLAVLEYVITEKPKPKSKAGIMLRCGQKSIGRPHFFGLEEDDSLTDALRCRVVGDVNVPDDALELIGGNSDVVESAPAYKALAAWIREQVKASIKECHEREFKLAFAKWNRQIEQALAKVPANRREGLRNKIQKLLSREFQAGKNQDRIESLVDLILTALDNDNYWEVCKQLTEADPGDVVKLATAAEQFGLCDLAYMVRQAHSRSTALDSLHHLARNPDTLEKVMHKALEENMWVFGGRYTRMMSNRTLKTIVSDFCDKRYAGDKAADRPDLLLVSDYENRKLLIEFKRPGIPLTRDHARQVEEYADILTKQTGGDYDIFVIGGRISPEIDPRYTGQRTKFKVYTEVISEARNELEWFLESMKQRTN